MSLEGRPGIDGPGPAEPPLCRFVHLRCSGRHSDAKPRPLSPSFARSAVGAGSETVAERCANRGGEAERRAAWGSEEGADRRGAGDAVGSRPRPALEATDGGGGVRAEAAVDGAGREAMPRQQELELGDVE